MNEIFYSDEEEADDGLVSDEKTGKIRRHFIHHNNQVKFNKPWFKLEATSYE